MRVLKKNWQYIVFALGLMLAYLFYSLPEVLNRIPNQDLWKVYQQAQTLYDEHFFSDAEDLMQELAEDMALRWPIRPLYLQVAAVTSAHPGEIGHLRALQPVLETLYIRTIFEYDGVNTISLRDEKEGMPRSGARQDLSPSEAKQVLLWLSTLAKSEGHELDVARYWGDLATFFPEAEYHRHVDIAELLQGPGIRQLDQALAHLDAYLEKLHRYASEAAAKSLGFPVRVYRGRILKDAGQLQEANRALVDVLDLYPDAEGIEEVFLYLGDIAKTEKRAHDALVLYDRATSYPVVNRFTQVAQFRKAEMLQEAERYPEAFSAFQRLLSPEMDPNVFFSALIRQGDVAFLDGDQPRAVELYRKAMDMLQGNLELFSPDLITLELFLDRLMHVAGDTRLLDIPTFEKAIQAVSMLCDAHEPSQSRHCRMLLAQLYTEFGDRLQRGQRPGNVVSRGSDVMYLSAADEYVNVLQGLLVSPMYRQALWNAGVSFFRGGYYPGALQMFERYKELILDDASATEADLYIGRCYRRLGEYAKAIDVFATINRKFPQRLQAYQSLLEIAKTYQDAFQYEMAATFYQRIFRDFYDYNTGEVRRSRVSPDSAVWREAEFALGKLYFLRGMYLEAEKGLQKGISRYAKSDPAQDGLDVHSGRFYLAMTYFLSEKFELAIPFFKTMAELEIENASGDMEEWKMKSNFRLGDCFFQLGQFDKAIEAYDTAISLYSRELESTWAHYQIGNAHYRLGNKTSGARAYDRALFLFANLDDAQFENLPANLDKQYWETLFTWVKTTRD